jgi:hypothetical protein
VRDVKIDSFVFPFFSTFFTKANEFDLLEFYSLKIVELFQKYSKEDAWFFSRLNQLIELKTPFIVGVTGFTENLRPNTKGPHYGEFYDQFSDALEDKFGTPLILIPLPEHNPFDDTQMPVGEGFEFDVWFDGVLDELQEAGAIFGGFYGNSTGAALMEFFARRHEDLRLHEEFKIFLSSPAIDVHFSNGQKVLAFLLRFKILKTLLQLVKKNFHMEPNAEKFRENYPNIERSEIEPFTEFSWNLMKAVLALIHNPKKIIKAYSQKNIPQVPVMIAYNPNDTVVDASAIEDFIAHLKKMGWPVFFQEFDGPGHSLPLTGHWKSVIEFFLNPS